MGALSLFLVDMILLDMPVCHHYRFSGDAVYLEEWRGGEVRPSPFAQYFFHMSILSVLLKILPSQGYVMRWPVILSLEGFTGPLTGRMKIRLMQAERAASW